MLVGLENRDALDKLIELGSDVKLIGSQFGNYFLHPFQVRFRVSGFSHEGEVRKELVCQRSQ